MITFPLSKFCTRRPSRLRNSAPCLTTDSIIFKYDSALEENTLFILYQKIREMFLPLLIFFIK
jgi:hypothetical protein